MSSHSSERLGLTGIDSLHFFVRDLARSRDHYVHNLGFSELAVSDAEHERSHGVRASLLGAGRVRFVLIAPHAADSECATWLAHHPEGVGRIVLGVEDAAHALSLLARRGATPLTGLVEDVIAGGVQRWFEIASPFGDTLFRFVERGPAAGMMAGLVPVMDAGEAPNRFEVGEIDHITSNFLTLKPVTLWLEQVLGFERYWGIEFHTQDVDKEHGGSGLKSIVMWDPASGIKLANNEPAAPSFRASQIYQFCLDHRGPGVQHVALTVRDIVHAVGAMRAREVAFMPTPAAYYARLPERLVQLGVERIDEPIETLSALEILVDGAGPSSYLLQIFLRDAAGLFADPGAGPFFVELIERKGDEGFGAGNFRALFESIERHQSGQRAA